MSEQTQRQAEKCSSPCFPDTGGSYVCGLERGHDGLHCSTYLNGAEWDETTVWIPSRAALAALASRVPQPDPKEKEDNGSARVYDKNTGEYLGRA